MSSYNALSNTSSWMNEGMNEWKIVWMSNKWQQTLPPEGHSHAEENSKGFKQANNG